MSLISFVKKRLQDLDNDAHSAAHVVKRDVVAPAVHVVSNVVNPNQQAPQASHPVVLPTKPHMNPIVGGLHSIVNFGSKVVDQANPLDDGRTFKQRTATSKNSAIHQLTHNGATNATGSIVNNLTGIPSVIDAGRLGVAELTHNQPAIDNATSSLAKNLPRFLPVSLAMGTKSFGQDVATAVTTPYAEHSAAQQADYARKVLGDNTNDKVYNASVDAYANAVETDLLNSHLNTAGIDMNTKGTTVARKVAGDAGTTAANIILASQMGNGALASKTADKLGISKLAGEQALNTAKESLPKQALKYGVPTAASGVAGTAQEENPTIGDYVRNGVTGFVEGAGIPAAMRVPGIVAKGGETAAATARDVATGKPFRSVSDSDLAAADRFRAAQSGQPDVTKPGDYDAYTRVQKQLGVHPDDTATIDNVIGARAAYDSRQAVKPKLTLQSEGGGKGTQYNGGGKAAHENFEQEYADALKHIDGKTTGGQMVPDGEGGYTRAGDKTPFYQQVVADTGKPPTNADYLAEAQRQLRSGKADNYAQAEYDGLKTQGDKTVETPNKPTTADALKRSQVEDSPTAINDVLLAKKAKLDDAQARAAAAQEGEVVQPAAGSAEAGAVHVEPSSDTDVSKFPARVAEDERAAPIKEDLEANSVHNILHNKDVVDAAKSTIARNEDDAVAFAKNGDSTEANATALVLIDKYLSEGKYEKAGELTKAVSPRFTRQGQETQILAIYSRLSPTGALRYAQREIDKELAKSGKGKKLENETNTTSRAINKTANDVADQLDTELKDGKLGTQKPAAGGKDANATKTGQTPEERLAARIKATEATKSKVPDPVTDMVNTLYKVAKEVLPADQAKSIPRDPMELIGAAVKDTENYKDVYDKAKAIVQDRYKDNPEAQAELEKYFGTDAKRSYAQSQVNAGVQSGLKGVDLGALVKQHYTAVDEVGTDLKTKLIERAGLSDEDATQLAGDIQKRYGELVQQRKDSIIKQIFGDKPTPKQTSAAEKILQYENLGALSKDDLRPLVGEKLGVPALSSDAIKEISDRAKAIQEMPEGIDRNRATAEMMKFIANQVPQKKLQGVLSIWKAGLLSGAKTQTGNLISNATFGALHKISDVQAAGMDAVLSKFTGKRTKTFTTRGIVSGTGEGVRKGFDTLRTGLDERNYTGDKFDAHGELNFKNPIIQNVFGKPSNFVFRGMSAADQPFYYAQAKNSLNDMALAEAKNRGLKGSAATDFVKNSVANPTTEMAERAKAEAEQAVLGQHSKLADSLQQFAQAHPLAQVVLPFIKVPTNFLSRTLDYTPVGGIKAAVNIMKDHHEGNGFDQRAFVQAVSEATTGSAILYLGAEMANHDLLSGAYPTDPKEQQRWKAQGITPNSVHINGKWISLNYLGPLGLLLGAGNAYRDAAAEGNNGAIQALSSFGQNLAGQSFLSGFNSFANAVQDPKRYANTLVNSEAGSVVPAWANDLAGIFDSQQRQAAGPGQTIESRIPIVRNHLPEKTDVYGNGLPQRTNATQLTVDPTRPSNDLGDNNPVIQEVARLHNVDKTNADLQVTPTPPTDINIEGKTVKLSADQKYKLQNDVGQQIQKQWGALIKTPEYQQLSDQDKAKALTNLRGDVTTLAERQFVVDNNLGTYTKSPSRAVQALGQNEAQLADYASNTQNSDASGVVLNKNLDSGSRKFLTSYNALSTDQRDKASYSQNDFDYKVAQAKYANDVANGSLSKAGLIKAQAGLAKDKVGTGYSRDVRDLYGLSNDELSDWLATSDPTVDKKALASQIIAYGDSLADAGVITKNKFRTSKGVITLGTKSSSGSGGSSKKAFKTVAIPSIKNNPFKSGGKKQTFKQAAMPKMKSVSTHHSYKTAALKTNISSKLRKA